MLGRNQPALVLLTALLLACQSLVAHPQGPSVKPFTLDEAIHYALANYPAVRAALEQVAASRSGVVLSRANYLPQLNGVYQASRATENQAPGIWLPTPITPTVEGPIDGSSGSSYWGSQAGALFSWEPFDFGLRSAIVGRARSAVDKSNADVALTQLQVAAAVGDYFIRVLASQQALRAAKANVDRWQVFNKSVHVLVEHQLRPGADASRADAQVALAKTQWYKAQETEEVALATLASLMGTAGSEIALDSGRLLDLPPVDSLPNLAPADHPLARDQMATLREVQTQEKVLNRTDYPRFFVQAEGFGRGSQVPNNGSIIGNWNGLAPARGNWVTGITVLFPDIFDFKALGAEKQISKARERSQQALYSKTLEDLTGQLQTALAHLKSAQLVAQQTPIEVAAARQSETQSRARYQAGLATLVEVADAETLLAQAETDDAVARVEVWRGLFGVAFAQGDLAPFLDLLHH